MATKMSIAKKVVDEETGTVTFAFTNGRKLVADVNRMPRDIVNRLALHGISQKGGDSYASANEKGWTIDDCFDEATRVIENLYNGIYNAKGGGSGTTILAEALARVTGETVEEAAAVIAGMSEDQVKDLGKHVDIKAAVLKIKAERAAERARGAEGGSATDLAGLFNK